MQAGATSRRVSPSFAAQSAITAGHTGRVTLGEVIWPTNQNRADLLHRCCLSPGARPGSAPSSPVTPAIVRAVISCNECALMPRLVYGLAARPGLLPDASRTLAGRPDSGLTAKSASRLPR